MRKDILNLFEFCLHTHTHKLTLINLSESKCKYIKEKN